MATKIPATHARLFKNVFVCKDCGQKMRAEPLKIINKQVKCRRCGKYVFRAVKTKKK